MEEYWSDLSTNASLVVGDPYAEIAGDDAILDDLLRLKETEFRKERLPLEEKRLLFALVDIVLLLPPSPNSFSLLFRIDNLLRSNPDNPLPLEQVGIA